MANRNSDQQIFYTSVLPSSKVRPQQRDVQRLARRDNSVEKTRPLYVEFENAFREDLAEKDHFGFQPWSIHDQPANFHLQSVETISEIPNSNFSPQLRYFPSRETSHSSTPVNRSPHPTQWTQSTPSDHFHSNQEFSNVNLVEKLKGLSRPHDDETRNKIAETTTINLTLPQYFLVKYLGRSSCEQLWGSNAVRTPIDEMIHNARQLTSMNELPTLEASVSRHGLTLTHRQSPTRHKHHRHPSRSPDRSHHGLIPLENISYAMHDTKYSKIASCIVLRQAKSSSNEQKHRTKTTETLTECYVFLFQSRDFAHRFALSLAQAFRNDKLTRPTQSSSNEKKETKDVQRSKHRHEKQRNDPNFVRDSFV